MALEREARSFPLYWIDVAWVVFVAMNLVAMRVLPAWRTVPFLAIWVSLTAIYGLRLWRLQPTIATAVAVALATGGVIGVQVLKGQEDPEYLVEVPLIALMFLVMVWQGRRRVAALDATRRVSEHNVRLLQDQLRFIQDASHELGTPITVALGHAALIERAATDSGIAEDARVVEDELLRLRRLTGRLLLLASAEGPDFLHETPIRAPSLIEQALSRWAHVPRAWTAGTLDERIVEVDVDRVTVALDALIENAVDHTEVDAGIELSARSEGPVVVLAVCDSGSGIPDTELARVFGRFARVDAHRNREAGGFGLGLAVVKAIAEAHQGSIRARSVAGQGAVFEILLPAASPISVSRPRLLTRDGTASSHQAEMSPPE